MADTLDPPPTPGSDQRRITALETQVRNLITRIEVLERFLADRHP